MITEADPGHSSIPWDDNLTNLSIGGILSEISLQRKINGSNPNSVEKSGLVSDVSIGGLFSEASLLGKMNNNPIKLENESSLQPIFFTPSDVSMGGLFSEASLFSNKLDKRASHEQIQSPWDDTFTTLSIGGLLSEVSLQAKAGGNTGPRERESSLEPNSCFSHLNVSQMPKQSRSEPSFSFLDAEETCHAFPIRKLGSSGFSNCSNPKGSQFPEVAKVCAVFYFVMALILPLHH